MDSKPDTVQPSPFDLGSLISTIEDQHDASVQISHSFKRKANDEGKPEGEHQLILPIRKKVMLDDSAHLSTSSEAEHKSIFGPSAVPATKALTPEDSMDGEEPQPSQPSAIQVAQQASSAKSTTEKPRTASGEVFGITELVRMIVTKVEDPSTLYNLLRTNTQIRETVLSTKEARSNMLIKPSPHLRLFKLIKLLNRESLAKAMAPLKIQSAGTKISEGLKVLNVRVEVVGDQPKFPVGNPEGSWRNVLVDYPGGNVVVTLVVPCRREFFPVAEKNLDLGERTTLGTIVSACENRWAVWQNKIEQAKVDGYRLDSREKDMQLKERDWHMWLVKH